MQPRSFLLATPCDDGHKLCFWDSLRSFERLYYAGKLPTSHRFSAITPPGDSLVPRARNNIAHFFLNNTIDDYLFSMDSDLDFRPADVLRLADICAEHDLDMLAGLYAIKQDDLRWCINAKLGAETDPKTGLLEITMAPGGLNVVHRRVFEKMMQAAPTWPHWRVEYTEDGSLREMFNFYFNGVVFDLEEFPDKPRGRYLSEDWGFSYFARKLGFKVWLDNKTVMLHAGQCFYPKQARRMTEEEEKTGKIKQPDGSETPIAKAEKV